MSEIKNSFLDLVGNTPLVRVNNLIKKDELKADVLAKLEYFNPAGSVKDRIAKEMIQDALEKGLINENTTLIEPTSGNTGIGLSAVATALNLKIIITMPETMSVERRNLMKAYGAELVLTPGSEEQSPKQKNWHHKSKTASFQDSLKIQRIQQHTIKQQDQKSMNKQKEK